MDTIKVQRQERLPGRSAEYAVGFVLLLTLAGLYFGFAVATIIGIMESTR